jgi:hypothetical protein
MTKREKQRDLFIELINYQLKDHGVKYEDVKENPSWYMQYSTTNEKEEDFIKHCVLRIQDVLKVSKADAEREASWFILQWGLTTVNTENKKEKESLKNIQDKRPIKGSNGSEY